MSHPANLFLEGTRSRLGLASAEEPPHLLQYALHGLFAVRGAKASRAAECEHPAVLQISGLATETAMVELANDDAWLPTPADWASATELLCSLPVGSEAEFARSAQYADAAQRFGGLERQETSQTRTGRIVTSMLTARLPEAEAGSASDAEPWTDAWLACGQRLGALDGSTVTYRRKALDEPLDPLFLDALVAALTVD